MYILCGWNATLELIFNVQTTQMLDYAEAFCRRNSSVKSYSDFITLKTCQCILDTKMIHPTVSGVGCVFQDAFEDIDDDSSSTSQ